MTNITKKVLSLCMAAMILVTASCVTALAEDVQSTAAADEITSEAKVKFVVGEPDENGVFSAKLSLHNMKFLAFQFGITFNGSVVNLVDEAGNTAEDFDEVAVSYPANVDGKSMDFSEVESYVSNDEGVIRVASYILIVNSDSNVVSTDEEGFVAYEFRFKRIADGDYGFDLADYPYANYEKEALVSGANGSVSFQFGFVYPEKTSDEEKSEVNYSFGSGRSDSSNVTASSDGSKEEQKAARLKDTVVLQINHYAVSVEGVIKWVDKDNKNVIPYIENDRTMIPLRFISEAFGADVSWIPETRTVEIVLGDTSITMQVDNTEYQLNGEVQLMDAAPVIREDRTFVPIRFVSEALDKSVYWNGSSGVVVVAPKDNPWDDEDAASQELLTQTLMTIKWLGDEAYSHMEN